MAGRLNDDETEKLVLSRGLITPERLAPFRVQASVDAVMLFDILVGEGIITPEIAAECEQKVQAAAAQRSGNTSIGFLRQPGAASPAPSGGTATIQRRTTRFHSFETTPAPKPGGASGVHAHVAAAPAQPAPIAPPPRAPPVSKPGSGMHAATHEPAKLHMPHGWPNGIAPADASAGHIQQFLTYARQSGASDLYAVPGSPFTIRLHGELRPVEGQPRLSAEQTREFLNGLLTSEQREFAAAAGDFCFCYEFEGGGRFRASVLKQRNGDELSFRVISDAIVAPGALALPEACMKLTQFADGLILIASQSGHGKTTTMYSLVDAVNAARAGHIIALDEPIEFLLPPRSCFVTQREAGSHTLDFSAGLHGALMEDPDIIVIGELRDYPTTMLAFEMSEAGQLVFATVAAADAARAIDRLLDCPDDSAQLRNMLADNLRAVLAQQLVPLKDGTGRVPACELLINSISVANIIREGKTQNLINVMQTGKQQGMMMMDDSLRALVNDEKITPEEAIGRAKNKATLKQGLAASKTGESTPAAEPPKAAQAPLKPGAIGRR